MELNFVPECYFDTILVRSILGTKRVSHRKGCDNVVKEIKSGRYANDFAVGIIDKDKKELDYIKDECIEINRMENLILWKHKDKMHYFIQLVPAIEKWVLAAGKESNIDFEEIGISKDLKKLKELTKTRAISENEELKRLCKALAKGEGKTITTLSKWLNHLYEHHREADINILKEDV